MADPGGAGPVPGSAAATAEPTSPFFADVPGNGHISRTQKKALKKAAKDARKRGEMTLIEHLEELRKRLMLSLLGVVVGSIVGWFLYQPILRLLVDPYRRATNNPEAKLVLLGVGEAFTIRLKTSALVGLSLALPFILYQIWRFVTPGLHKKEKRYAAPFIISAVLLFALGAYFAWLTFPAALDFLLGFGGPETLPLLTAEKYLNFIFLMILAFGASFQFPVILQFAVIAGVVSSKGLRSFRRWAVLLITIFAAVITPSQDPLSMLLMAGPMVVFYEAVIWISRLILKK